MFFSQGWPDITILTRGLTWLPETFVDSQTREHRTIKSTRTAFGLPTCLFTAHSHVLAFDDVTRPHKGAVRSRSDDFYPSDSNPHLWVCKLDAIIQTQAGAGALRGRVLGVLSDPLGPVYEEVSISGLDHEVGWFPQPCADL